VGDFVWAILYGRFCVGDFVWATFGGRLLVGDFWWAIFGGVTCSLMKTVNPF
jgi:hypothetical protein